MTQQKYTFCRICEPFCPMIADLDDAGDIVGLRPDAEHPSGGIPCHKGLSYIEIHQDPDRLDYPMKRLNPRTEEKADFQRLDWDTAMEEMAGKLKAVQEKYGADAVAQYSGNPAAFNFAGLALGGQFPDMIGTRMRFSANTMDTANKFYVAGLLYGSMSTVFVPDIYNTDYFVCIGGNPKVSRWTLLSMPNDGGQCLKDIKARGGKVLFVNPRKIESSNSETGETLRIKPATDLYFLAAVLNEIHAQDGFDKQAVETHAKNIDGLIEFVSRYPAERVAAITGIDAETIRQIAAETMAAKSAAFYMATGVNQSRQGGLCHWLVEMINFVTGNLGRQGGTYMPRGWMDYFPPVSPDTQTLQTSMGDIELPDPVGYQAVPGVLFQDLIENDDIKALIAWGGNPLITMGGGERMRKAFEKLEVIITIDILPSATAEMSDYVLPAADFLERSDINTHGNCKQPIPYVQYTEAMVPPKAERKNDWWIFARLAQEMGVPSPLDDPNHRNGEEIIDGVLSASSTSIDELKRNPRGLKLLGQGEYDDLFERCIAHPDKKIDCHPGEFEEGGLYERCEEIFIELEQESPDVLKLVTLRTTHMHNSWMTNMEKFRRGKHINNPLNICEKDAASYGLHNGDRVRVFNEYGSIETLVLINDDLLKGAVAMSHGYGNKHSYNMRTASDKLDSNCNELLPIGPGTYEPLTHMSWASGIPVEIERIAG